MQSLPTESLLTTFPVAFPCPVIPRQRSANSGKMPEVAVLHRLQAPALHLMHTPDLVVQGEPLAACTVGHRHRHGQAMPTHVRPEVCRPLELKFRTLPTGGNVHPPGRFDEHRSQRTIAQPPGLEHFRQAKGSHDFVLAGFRLGDAVFHPGTLPCWSTDPETLRQAGPRAGYPTPPRRPKSSEFSALVRLMGRA